MVTMHVKGVGTVFFLRRHSFIMLSELLPVIFSLSNDIKLYKTLYCIFQHVSEQALNSEVILAGQLFN